jgi:ubiquinone/menaquinone biosynthesis C-methylase UbiE
MPDNDDGGVEMPVRYDELANEFDERYRHQSFPGIQAWLRWLATCPGTKKVLEVGCGTGHWLNVLSDLPVELTGLDPACGMLEKARARATRAGLVCASAERIPFQAKSFDLIFCVNAFHHFSDPKKFLRSSRLLLRKGGRLAIFGLDPHAPGTDWYLYDYFPGVRAADLRRYSPTIEIKRLMAEAGFNHLSAEPAERIQATFTDDSVFQDPFLIRESTSQLLLISEESYLEGKRAVAAAVAKASREGRSIFFRVNLGLFVTVGVANGT